MMDRPQLLRFVLACFLACCLGALPAHAAPRGVALVIGNAVYADKPLKNPVNDARDLAEALRKSGFEVMLKQNLSADQMKEAIADFGDRLARERTVGLFYFSGHGMQTSKGQNFLLPVGRDYKRERDVEFYAVEARSVLSQMESAGNPLNIVVLDACRDAPLPAEARSAGSKGLARMEAPSGSIIAFATAPGRTASDNPGERNGLYTKHLIAAINTPGLRLEDVFKRVGRNVEADSNRQQSPEEMMKLRDDTPFFFTPGEVPQVIVQPAPSPYRPAPVVTPSPPSVDPGEAAYWSEVKKSEDAADYAAYLTAYPNGRYVADANEYIERDKQARAAREKLKEDQAWQRAQSGESYASYSTYLKSYPTGRYARLAELKLKKLGGAARDCPDCPEMVAIPAGSFQMGSNDGDSDEKPVHQVSVNGFVMSKTEITNRQFRQFRPGHDSGNYEGQSLNGDDQPVVNVSWDDARAYVQWLAGKTGQAYRLPSEAEWEYANRAGTTSKWIWGNDENGSCQDANIADQTAKARKSDWTTSNCTDGHFVTAPVGSFRANGFGLYDMTGNVWEWVEDCYHDSYSGAAVSQEVV